MSVNRTLFRLRVFENEWIKPLFDGEFEMAARAMPSPAGMHLLALTRVFQLASSDLSAVLTTEIEHWYTLGEKMKYFAPAGKPELPPIDDFDASMFFRASYDTDMFGKAIELEHDVFAQALGEARDDLFPARLRFLHLVVFADSREWDKAVGEVQRVASVLSRRPWAEIPVGAIDRISWSLSGGELSRSAKWSPASWRMGALSRPDPEGARLSSEIYERLSVLQETREPIKHAMEWLAQDEVTSPAVRFVAEQQTERDRKWRADAGFISDEDT